MKWHFKHCYELDEPLMVPSNMEVKNIIPRKQEPFCFSQQPKEILPTSFHASIYLWRVWEVKVFLWDVKRLGTALGYSAEWHIINRSLKWCLHGVVQTWSELFCLVFKLVGHGAALMCQCTSLNTPSRYALKNVCKYEQCIS